MKKIDFNFNLANPVTGEEYKIKSGTEEVPVNACDQVKNMLMGSDVHTMKFIEWAQVLHKKEKLHLTSEDAKQLRDFILSVQQRNEFKYPLVKAIDNATEK